MVILPIGIPADSGVEPALAKRSMIAARLSRQRVVKDPKDGHGEPLCSLQI